MARSRLYGWNGETPAKELTGQKAIVFQSIRAAGVDALKTGRAWSDEIAASLATRQDPYRVVLYYLLGLKKDGVIRTAESEIEAVTKTEAGRHAITVKTDSAVEEREALPADEAEDEPDDDEDDEDDDEDLENEDEDLDEDEAEQAERS